MNELGAQRRQLPDNLPDLAKFVLVGREKLNAVRAEIRAIKAINLAVDVHEQKLSEAQDIAEAVLDAEAKIGELTRELEKAKGRRTDIKPIRSGADKLPKTKAEALSEIGIKQDTAERFERLATHPETVEQAKADARAEGRIVTRQDVLNRIVVAKPKEPSIIDMKSQARQEHADFVQKKNDDVVSFDEIKRDKENIEIIDIDTVITIRKVISSISTLLIIPKSDIDSLKKHLDDGEKRELLTSLRNAISILSKFEFEFGGEK